MKKNFIIGINRDPSLISYCDPDLIITTNRVTLKKPTDIIALNDFAPAGTWFPLYDTDIIAMVAGIFPERTMPEQYKMLAKKAYPACKKAINKKIKKESRTKNIIINSYFNTTTTSLRKKGYTIIGPRDNLVYYYSRKTIAYQLAKACSIPVPPGKIVKNISAVERTLTHNPQKSFFVASDDDPFFPTNIHARHIQDLATLKKNIPYLVTEWLSVKKNQNSQVLIGKNNMLYLGVSDQIIRHGVKYFGNTYPTTLAKKYQKTIQQYSLTLAKNMQQQGYRGIVGFDWMIDDANNIFFTEINPRKNRSTGILISMLDQYRAKNTPSIFELELLASQNKMWNTTEFNIAPNICWHMELIKSKNNIQIKKNIIPAYSESRIFKNIIKTKTSILNFPPKETRITKNHPDIARIIVTGTHRQNIKRAVHAAKKKIIDT